MEDKARLVAVSTLYDMEIKNSYSNLKINENFIKYDLSSIDRSFATEIIYGTIRWKMRIDYLIQKNIMIRIDELSKWVLICIRTAIYQIFFMDKVPEFAAVNEAVNLAKMNAEKGIAGAGSGAKTADAAASFTNGVLRSILRNKDEFNKIGVKNKTKRLSIEYSHPEWFVKKYNVLFGEEFIRALMKINNTPPELTARVNTLKTDTESLLERLQSKDILVRKGRLKDSIVFDGYSMIEKSEEFREGYFIFQDESSMLVALVLDPQPGDIVIDMCSAPGGKTTHMAQLMNNSGEINAFDIYKNKLSLIEENANKLGIDIIKTNIADATIPNNRYFEYADKVLVDAPCSGLGLIRKKPEIRWNITENDITELKILQLQILKNASNYVKKNGYLVYSTCTISEEENEQVIEEFLNANHDFEFDDIEKYLPDKFKTALKNHSYVKLFPNINDCDGFFIAKFKRVR